MTKQNRLELKNLTKKNSVLTKIVTTGFTGAQIGLDFFGTRNKSRRRGRRGMFDLAQDSSDDEEFWIEYLDKTCRLPKVFLERKHPFDDLSDKKFKERYRLNKSTVLRLLDEVSCNRNRQNILFLLYYFMIARSGQTFVINS